VAGRVAKMTINIYLIVWNDIDKIHFLDKLQSSGNLPRLIAPLYKCAKGRNNLDHEPVAFAGAGSLFLKRAAEVQIRKEI